MVLLAVQGIKKSFGALKALDGAGLTIAKKSFHGLIGPNGSGKSTLLKAIAGAHFADAGTVVFNGQDVTHALPYERSRAGMSLKFQITAVLPELSVYDNVLLAMQAHQSPFSLARSRSRAQLHDRVMQPLTDFRLAGRADDLAGELSHGEQQWLEIAMALALKPKLLLLDEPTGGMSPQERQVTGELLRPIKDWCSLLIVEHDLDFIRDLCDRLTVLDHGQVLDEGTVDEIQRSDKVKKVYTTRE